MGKPSLGKGYRDFEDAARLLRWQGVEAEFVHVGPKPDPATDDDPVEHVGFHDRLGVEAWLCRAEIVVVPSRIPDALPRVALEAMAHGRFLVVSDRGGLPECVKPGATGFVVPAGQPQKLAEAIGNALADLDRRRTGEEWARRLAKDRYAPEKIAEAHERMYEGLVH